MLAAAHLATRWPALDVPGKRARLERSAQISPGALGSAFVAPRASADRAAAGLWARNPAAWSTDPGVQKKIADRLGWLDAPVVLADALDRLHGFASSIVAGRFTDVVLLGMGGSSLAPEVLRAVVGGKPGWPRFQILDSTDPAAVRAAFTPASTTLYLLASKSGTTIEPNSLAAFFERRLAQEGVARPAEHFVAITDEGTALASRARAAGFRDVFINPSDIGGRYSALSYFGLVPAALMGLDVRAILGWGIAMLAAADPSEGRAADANPAVALGLAMAASVQAGRDKLTLILPERLQPFGLWVEQLIAESTGKNGTGIVPIAGEPPDLATSADRLFVTVRISADTPGVRPLPQSATNAPHVDIEMPEVEALGAEFVRWEVATAIAGALLNINPFDEPNVQQAKDATRALLARYTTEGALPTPADWREQPADRTGSSARSAAPDGVRLSLSEAAHALLANRPPDDLLTLVQPGDYVAILAFLGPDEPLASELAAFRRAAGAVTGAATMFGYGPRYLHSTGQLHKGGANSGVFLLISATPREDLAIPGEPFSFGTLELAQALGDFQSLDRAGRRALHVHLPVPDAALLRDVRHMLTEREPFTRASR